MHKSWGFGEVKTVDGVLGKMTVDFADRLGHAVDLAFAPKILTPISKDHIEARMVNDREGIKEAVRNHHAIIKVIIDSYGDLATNDKVREVLVPDWIEEDDYKKWWETARREMKKDGHFTLPPVQPHPTPILSPSSRAAPMGPTQLLFSNGDGLARCLVFRFRRWVIKAAMPPTTSSRCPCTPTKMLDTPHVPRMPSRA